MADHLDQLVSILQEHPDLAESLLEFATAATRGPDGEDVDLPELRRLDRYEDRGLVGVGGMGLVRRVFDPDLERTVVLKSTRPELEGLVAALLNEARVTARLQHPGIVPVYELGTLEDGRPYFTMREVRGRSLRQLLDEGLELRTAINHLRGAAVAVAFAHDLAVIHRDLKPENILVGRRGEVVVADWGIARELDQNVRGASGTPAYMAPEQAVGGLEDERTDVWALGMVLYEILYGHPAFGRDPQAALEALHAGVALEFPTRAAVPPELAVLATRCLSRRAEGRPKDAAAVVDALQDWLDGANRRERARGLVEQADELQASAQRCEREAEVLRERAAAALESLPTWADVEVKASAWELEERAATLSSESSELVRRWEQLLSTALELVPDFEPALCRLADHHKRGHLDAERAHDTERAESCLRQLEYYDRGAHAAYVKGDGALTLHTSPPAEAVLYRYTEIGRRLRPVRVRSLGRTPIDAVTLPMGSYVVELEAPGYHTATYPVWIGRQQHWDGIPPGGTAPEPIPLLRQGVLGPDEVYVPAGWFQSGSPEDVPQMLPFRRVWCDGMVVERYLVTARRYFAWLNELIDTGRVDDALRWAPRVAGPQLDGELAPLFVGLSDRGRFEISDPVEPDHPAVYLTIEGCEAFAAWRAEQSGRPWRLPSELEWEKAARGVDARIYPWGSWFEPTWCRMRESYDGPPLPAAVDQYPIDASPYGMVGISGNVQVQCRDLRVGGGRVEDGRVVVLDRPTYEPEESYTMRGGLFHQLRGRQLSIPFRGWRQARGVFVYCGVRLFRSLTPEDL